MADYAKVRALTRCVNCSAVKPQGLLLCWPCHHSQKRQFDGGYDPMVIGCFELIENGAATIDENGKVYLGGAEWN